jgi:hypothetical protein
LTPKIIPDINKNKTPPSIGKPGGGGGGIGGGTICPKDNAVHSTAANSNILVLFFNFNVSLGHKH